MRLLCALLALFRPRLRLPTGAEDAARAELDREHQLSALAKFHLDRQGLDRRDWM